MIRRTFRFEDEDYLKARREPWVCYIADGDGPDGAGGGDRELYPITDPRHPDYVAPVTDTTTPTTTNTTTPTTTNTTTGTPTTTNTTTGTPTTTNTTTTDTTPVYTKPKAPTPSDKVASAQDVVAGMPTLGGPTNIPDPAQRTVNVQELVEYRMSQMMQDDNPYLQASVARAKQFANQQGLLNTSIAASAGVDAAIRSILPIAQQDAATLHGQALENQRAVNEFLMQDYLMKNQFKLSEYGYQVNTYNQGIEQAHQQNESAIDRWWKANQNTLDRELQIWGTEFDAELQKLLKSMGIEAVTEEGNSACADRAKSEYNAYIMEIEAQSVAGKIDADRRATLMQTAKNGLISQLQSCAA